MTSPPPRQKRRKNLNGGWFFIKTGIKLGKNLKKEKADFLKRKTNISQPTLVYSRLSKHTENSDRDFLITILYSA